MTKILNKMMEGAPRKNVTYHSNISCATIPTNSNVPRMKKDSFKKTKQIQSVKLFHKIIMTEKMLCFGNEKIN